jgi:3-hydroxyacyl-CoA dehydrogenase
MSTIRKTSLTYCMNDINMLVKGWVKHYPDLPENSSFIVPRLLQDLVSSGKLGVKTGEGFYKYDKGGN